MNLDSHLAELTTRGNDVAVSDALMTLRLSLDGVLSSMAQSLTNVGELAL